MATERTERRHYRAFREQLLEGASPDNPLDTPQRRAIGAAGHLRAQAVEAGAAVRRTEALVAKVRENAERDIAAAEEALETFRADEQRAIREADWAAELVKDLDAADPAGPGEQVQAPAQVATGQGGA